jgi:hypothetical protein
VGIDALLVRLVDGEQAEADAPAMLAILVSIGVDISGNADNIQTADGFTTVYNMQSAGELLAFSKPSGDAVWDIIHQVASAGAVRSSTTTSSASQIPITSMTSMTT